MYWTTHHLSTYPCCRVASCRFAFRPLGTSFINCISCLLTIRSAPRISYSTHSPPRPPWQCHCRPDFVACRVLGGVLVRSVGRAMACSAVCSACIVVARIEYFYIPYYVPIQCNHCNGKFDTPRYCKEKPRSRSIYVDPARFSSSDIGPSPDSRAKSRTHKIPRFTSI